MIQFLQLNVEDRKILNENISQKTGLSAQSIEKDWWVTVVLRALFSLPMAEHFIIKGGTSLSKAWNHIERFSEDIDIALSPSAFGRTYVQEPSHSFVKALKKEGCAYTSSVIRDALMAQLIQMGVSEYMVKIESDFVKPDRPDKDPQTLFINYPTIYAREGYLLDTIKLEFGVRSLLEPFATAEVISIMGVEAGHKAYEETSFSVTAVEPRKTFMEKMMLLHEKYLQGINPKSGERQSRHLYDLNRMTKMGIAKEVIADHDLNKTLLKHRSHYVRLKGIDYDSMLLHNLTFIPPQELLEFFRNDYDSKIVSMMYGDIPSFDEVMGTLIELEKTFGKKVIRKFCRKGLMF